MKINEIKEIRSLEVPKILSNEKYFKDGFLNLRDFENLEGIDDYVFYEKGIKGVRFPRELKYIGERAFKRNKIKELDLSETEVYMIGGEGFFGNGMERVKMSYYLKEVGWGVFENNCLKEVDLEFTYLERIRGDVFRNNQIEKVTFPKGLFRIMHGAFADNKLKVVDFKCTEKKIIEETFRLDALAFANNQIEDVKFPKGKKYFLVDDDAFLNNEKFSLEKYKPTF